MSVVKIHGDLRQGCVMSPWLFSVYMNGVLREMKASVCNIGADLCMNNPEWKLSTVLFADDTVFIAKDERDLNDWQRDLILLTRGINLNKYRIRVR